MDPTVATFSGKEQNFRKPENTVTVRSDKTLIGLNMQGVSKIRFPKKTIGFLMAASNSRGRTNLIWVHF